MKKKKKKKKLWKNPKKKNRNFRSVSPRGSHSKKHAYHGGRRRKKKLKKKKKKRLTIVNRLDHVTFSRSPFFPLSLSLPLDIYDKKRCLPTFDC